MMRTALVTGATGDLGFAISKRLLRDGHRLVLHGRNAEKVSQAATQLQTYVDAAAVFCVVADIATPIGRAELKARLGEAAISVDVLVNCAGGGGMHETWWDTTDEKWEDCFHLNVMGTVGLCKILVPAMKQRGWGRVINIASVAGLKPLAIGPEYAAAKAAVHSLTVSLALECANSGVTVNSISPGLCMTTKVQGFLEAQVKASQRPAQSLDEFASQNIFHNLVNQLTRPEDIGELVSLLVSDHGSRMTAQDFVVDGGYTAAPSY